jgi:hypothetical protein
LQEPNSNSPDDIVQFLYDLAQDARNHGTWINIIPPKAQIDKWKITYNRAPISIGVTAPYYDFPAESRNYQVSGLTGCTMAIAIVRQMFSAMPIHLY